MLKKYYRLHNKVKTKNDFQEQFCDIEEYIIRRCEADKIDWRSSWSNWNFKLKMATQYGCRREFIDGMYQKKHAI